MGWAETSRVERKTQKQNRLPEFYGRGVSLDGPRGTIDPEQREEFDAGMKQLVGILTGQHVDRARGADR